ncbi:efflux RND transporter permease subunit [Candidatus Uabimicrobium sp. HlEnr_7]|uniref:efflux RND transporter permease subunit n=1 Tax=Candidatus Uabimicrobium helgolandensis TaxID=3095367 RepID=UPI00355728F4
MDTLFFRYPRLLILTLLFIVLSGISSFYVLPRIEDPELPLLHASVKIKLPGVSPERIESLVTEKIESELAEFDEIKTVISTTTQGISDIQIILKDHIYNVEQVWPKIRDKINVSMSNLPAEASKPKFKLIAAKADALIIALISKSNEVNYSILKRRAKELKNQFDAIFGTEKVEIYGEPQEEIKVEVDIKTVESGLSINNIAEQIRNSDLKKPVGRMQTQQNEMLIEVKGSLSSLSSLHHVPVVTGKSGNTLHLNDIAKIEKTIRRPLSSFAYIKGKPAIVLGLKTISSQRIDLWLSEVDNVVNSYRKQLPDDLELQVIFRQNNYTELRLQKLFDNLLKGLLLVMCIIFFIMGWKSALTVCLALPLSCLMIISGMKLLSIPIHQVSVTGIIISLGLLVDNAIVVIDELEYQLIKKEGLAALKTTVQHLVTPLTSSTLTTIFAFMPMVIMPGPIGAFVGPIGVNVMLALCSSLFLSLTIIPSLHVFFYKLLGKKHSTKIRFKYISSLYYHILKFFLKQPILCIVVCLLLPVWGFLKAVELPEQFFPPSDRDQIQIEFEFPAIMSIKQTQKFVRQAHSLLLESSDIINSYWFIGESAPVFYYNLPRGREGVPFYAQSLVQLRSWQNSAQVVQKLQILLNDRFPSARVIVRLLEQGPLIESPIELRIYGSDIEILRAWGDKARKLLFEIPDVIHTRASFSEVSPRLQFHLDEDKVKLTGLNYRQILQQLNSLIEGKVVGSIVEMSEELPVRVVLKGIHQNTPDRINSLYLFVNDEDKHRVPLSSLGGMKLIPNLSSIYRRNRQRYNIVQAFLTAETLPTIVLEKFKEVWEEKAKNLPPGYYYEFGGENEEKGEAVGHLVSTTGVLFFLIFATLVLSLQSFFMAIVICFIALLSIGLGLGGLWFFSHPFGFMAILGSLGLIGIAVNDSLVVICGIKRDVLNSNDVLESVCQSVMKSTRHVIATSITTIIGFAPIIMSQSKFWPPMVIPISGGIIGATMLALYFLPSIYLLRFYSTNKI